MDLWTTKDGREIYVKDMSSKHIVNCINMLEKKQPIKRNRRRWIAIFREELSNRKTKSYIAQQELEKAILEA